MTKSRKIFLIILAMITATFILYSLSGNKGFHFSNKNQEPISERTYSLAQLQQDFKQFQETIENKHPKLYTDEDELSKSAGLTAGRGVMPDYEVKPSLDDYLTGNDPVKKFALELIDQK